MADELDDGVFWLPSQFLTDDDDFLTNDDINETESDEFIQKIATCTLHDYPSKGQKLSSSPQSTLYGSSRGSPNSVSSPPDANGLDFLYEAAQQVARMRMLEQLTTRTTTFYSNGFYPTHNPDPFSYHLGIRNGPGFWPTMQQSNRPGSGVFLGERKERTGTGVFLPRTNNNNVHRKQPGSSPQKVVHALDLNLHYGVGLKQRNVRPVVKQELGLPQEWTY